MGKLAGTSSTVGMGTPLLDARDNDERSGSFSWSLERQDHTTPSSTKNPLTARPPLWVQETVHQGLMTILLLEYDAPLGLERCPPGMSIFLGAGDPRLLLAARLFC